MNFNRCLDIFANFFHILIFIYTWFFRILICTKTWMRHKDTKYHPRWNFMKVWILLVAVFFCVIFHFPPHQVTEAILLTLTRKHLCGMENLTVLYQALFTISEFFLDFGRIEWPRWRLQVICFVPLLIKSNRVLYIMY